MRAFLTFSLLICGLAAAANAATQREGLPFMVAESGRGYVSLTDAVDAIGDGAGTILIQPGVYGDCAVQEAGRIVYRADTAGRVVFDGGICEDKAALVLRGEAARIEGVIFQNMRVSDGNGAGIRLEQGDLTIVNSLFRDSQQGILTADDPAGTIRIERSTFSGLGRCGGENACAHSIYIGDYGALVVSRSRFERGMGGHYVKSRSPRVRITDSSFDDTRGRATNYMIDLPEGATGTITRNIFVQGRDKENWSAFIAVGAEDIENSSAGLAISDNEARIAPGPKRSPAFVADWTGDALRLGANRLGPHIKPFERR